MLLILMAAAAAGNATPARETPVFNPNRAERSTCPPTSRYEAARRGGKLPPSLLNQLPAADLYMAVYRRVDGCVAPVIVRYGIGSGR
jgi:hypothetical protein